MCCEMKCLLWIEQVNKNWLAKVLVGTDAAVAALAFKAWWQPSFTLAANAGVRPLSVLLSMSNTLW